ncbi:tumor necrosis factor ligand superfamily member 14-like protein [Lates japonicus]|uniref:Tumor necrosis factor ligand superfamily member 14-like protein n=1 Tax=Lates japonicus TaxID=270547 RepID=A0AAD3MQI1_LATJO|nr:tumor necrosis factor ligand superfamily member 14-like protein [Lates japonicus]
MEEAGVELETRVTYSPVPQNPGQVQPSFRVPQKLLFMMVTMVLCGLIREAFFIHRLYHQIPDVSALTSNTTSGQEEPSFVQPSKAFAHLSGGSAVVHENQIMHWSINTKTLLHDIDHREGRLVIQKEGYYYVYSKISYRVHMS